MTTTKPTQSGKTGQSPIRIIFEGRKYDRTLTELEDVTVDIFFRDGYLSVEEHRPLGYAGVEQQVRSLVSIYCKILWRSDK